MKKKILSFLLAMAMAFSVASVYAEDVAMHPEEEQVVTFTNKMTKALIKMYAHDIADNFYYGVSDAQLLYTVICNAIDEGTVVVDKAVEAMIGTLKDDYAEFYNPQEYASLTVNVSGEFSGIGVVITANDKGVLVSSVMDESPALRAGMKAGDIITAINGTPIAGMVVSDVRNLIVGATNTEVKVSVLRGDDTLEMTCIRGKVEVPNIETAMLTDDIAYLKIVQFAQNTPEDVAEYVKELQKKSVKKLVVDVRDNPGGELDAAVKISSTFVSAGRLVELRYKDSSKNTFVKSENFHAPSIKMAVLVNENSASASELFTTAMKSRGKTIIGTKTFGKGSMQAVKQLYTGSAMKYTIGEFYSVKGERIHTVGITPTIYVENEVVSVDEESFAEIDYKNIDEAGKNGEMTLALEQRLYALGALVKEPDEVFDEDTANAVKALQLALGYEATGVPGFYEYMYLNDFDYDFETVVDKQLDAAIEYLSK